MVLLSFIKINNWHKRRRANIEEARKRSLETFTRTSRKTTEANDE